MKPRWLLAMTILVLSTTGRGTAQDLLLSSPDAIQGFRSAGGQFSLLPAESRVVSTSPLFVDEGNAARRNTVTGTLGGVGASSSGDGRVSVGFDYLRPFWSYNDFTLAIPPAFAKAFPAFAGIGHTDNQFAFAPQVRYDYHVPDLGIDIGAAGTFLSLGGRIQRNIAATNGDSGDLVAAYNLTLVSVIPVQVARRLTAAELFGEDDHDTPAGSLIDLSIGTRYIALDQSYTSTLNSAGTTGVNVATQYASQRFRGLGITAAMGWQVPSGRDWVTFIGGRGSVLIGENQRSSTATAVAAGLPAFADSISESKTTLLPVGEVEAGVEWGQELGDRLARGEVPPAFTVRLAGIGQYWGGMGPLSAGSTQGFKTSDLFLAGVSVQIGLRH